MPLLLICMGLVLVAIPIFTLNQTMDLVSGYPSHKGSEKYTSSILNILTLLDEGLELGLELEIYILCWPMVVTPIPPLTK